jgi:hypothetical protein
MVCELTLAVYLGSGNARPYFQQGDKIILLAPECLQQGLQAQREREVPKFLELIEASANTEDLEENY